MWTAPRGGAEGTPRTFPTVADCPRRRAVSRRTVSGCPPGLPVQRIRSIIDSMEDTSQPAYDALLLVSFGGPERPEDVMPFLENVLRGKPVPRERMLEVAEHYYRLGGISPINAQNRALIGALEAELQARG